MSGQGGQEEDRPITNALINEFKTLRDKLKSDDDSEYRGKCDSFILVFLYLLM